MSSFWTFFAFPLNLLLALLWACGWGWLWKNRPDNRIVKFLLSPAATISSRAYAEAVAVAYEAFKVACGWQSTAGDVATGASKQEQKGGQNE